MAASLNYLSAKKNALNKFFGHLNNEQRDAVYNVNGSLLILAGAGSGKTTVLVNRIANMIKFGNAYLDENIPAFVNEDDINFLQNFEAKISDESRLADIVAVNPIEAWRILAITFTNKAAKELRERLENLLGEDGEDITAATFHSVCVRILRKEIHNLGYTSDFTIYDSDDSQRLLKSCYNSLDISDKMFAPKSVLSEISRAKDKLITPAEFEAKAFGDYRKSAIAKLYTAYQHKLKLANAVDFDDIINLTVRLFEEFPDVLDHYSNRYKYILVDEYQDTNYAQLCLVTLLSGKYKNICVVGDDDQSIYKFRGATIENILKFTEQFENSVSIRLEQNYRSTENILEAANSIISNNQNRNYKKLWTDLGTGDKITVYKASDDISESKFAAETISDGIKNGKKYSDYAVLYRMNAQSNSFERTFTFSGIPYKVIGGLKFYDRKEIKDVIAYLSVINNNHDMLRFKRIVNEPKRGIGDATISLLEQMSNDMNLSPIELMTNADEYPLLSKKANSLKKISLIFDKLSEASDELPLDELLDLVLQKTNYKAALEAEGDEGITRLENIEELKSTMVYYMNDNPDSYSLSGFLEEISLYTDVEKIDSTADAVYLMTIHSAKGLEFDSVFLAGMEDGIFPSTRSLDTIEDTEEERRLAYVAITRAKKHLYISHAKRRMIFGQTSRNLLSRFVKEIPVDYLVKISDNVKVTDDGDDNFIQSSSNPYSLQNQISNLKNKQSNKNSSVEYSSGERVKHNVFGEGMIISTKKMGNDTLLEVAFDNSGTKKIMANFAKLKKL